MVGRANFGPSINVNPLQLLSLQQEGFGATGTSLGDLGDMATLMSRDLPNNADIFSSIMTQADSVNGTLAQELAVLSTLDPSVAGGAISADQAFQFLEGSNPIDREMFGVNAALSNAGFGGPGGVLGQVAASINPADLLGASTGNVQQFNSSAVEVQNIIGRGGGGSFQVPSAIPLQPGVPAAGGQGGDMATLFATLLQRIQALTGAQTSAQTPAQASLSPTPGGGTLDIAAVLQQLVQAISARFAA